MISLLEGEIHKLVEQAKAANDKMIANDRKLDDRFFDKIPYRFLQKMYGAVNNIDAFLVQIGAKNKEYGVDLGCVGQRDFVKGELDTDIAAGGYTLNWKVSGAGNTSVVEYLVARPYTDRKPGATWEDSFNRQAGLLLDEVEGRGGMLKHTWDPVIPFLFSHNYLVVASECAGVYIVDSWAGYYMKQVTDPDLAAWYKKRFLCQEYQNDCDQLGACAVTTTVQGTVTVDGTGEAGIEVSVAVADDSSYAGWGVTGDGGAFSFGGVPANKGNITVTATFHDQSKTAGPKPPVAGDVTQVGIIKFTFCAESTENPPYENYGSAAYGIKTTCIDCDDPHRASHKIYGVYPDAEAAMAARDAFLKKDSWNSNDPWMPTTAPKLHQLVDPDVWTCEAAGDAWNYVFFYFIYPNDDCTSCSGGSPFEACVPR